MTVIVCPARSVPSLLSLLGLATALAGCVKTPTMSVAGAEISGATLQGLTMNVFLTVDNPNGYDIRLRAVRATTTLVGLRQPYPLAPISHLVDRWLTARQTTRVLVPIVIPWPTVTSLAFEIPFSPQVSYHVHGDADVSATSTFRVDRDSMPFDARGTIPRQTLLTFARLGPPAR